MPELLDMLDRAWRPAIEILILAVGLYYVFTFVRGRRGAAIVTGFLVVVLTLALVTNFLQLTVLGRLLGSIAAFAVIAVVVIFQPEIRQMLARVGNLQVFGTAHEQREAIEVVIRAAERLSEAHIGGLIAIEQSVPLQDEVENILPVNCEATP
ncbi:MAG TPA: TIGR00159 family protein, partial [Verrucomicrobiae bacterium]|nr:TIGR00159 family protein [Verrucomicrobiae bacterium]